jgi:hypothetical protein
MQFYSFSQLIPVETSISSFTVQVTTTSGSTVYNNNGAGFPVEDSIIFQSPESCLTTGSNGNNALTITALVR